MKKAEAIRRQKQRQWQRQAEVESMRDEKLKKHVQHISGIYKSKARDYDQRMQEILQGHSADHRQQLQRDAAKQHLQDRQAAATKREEQERLKEARARRREEEIRKKQKSLLDLAPPSAERTSKRQKENAKVRRKAEERARQRAVQMGTVSEAGATNAEAAKLEAQKKKNRQQQEMPTQGSFARLFCRALWRYLI